MSAEACKAKIILDGGSVVGYGQAITSTIENLSDKAVEKFLTDDVAIPIIEQLIKAEYALDKVHNMILDAVGYKGPRPNGYQ